MGYPKYNRHLVFRRIGKDSYKIKDFMTEEEWITNAKYARFLKALDGHTDPYEIDPALNTFEVRVLLRAMEDKG